MLHSECVPTPESVPIQTRCHLAAITDPYQLNRTGDRMTLNFGSEILCAFNFLALQALLVTVSFCVLIPIVLDHSIVMVFSCELHLAQITIQTIRRLC